MRTILLETKSTIPRAGLILKGTHQSGRGALPSRLNRTVPLDPMSTRDLIRSQCPGRLQIQVGRLAQFGQGGQVSPGNEVTVLAFTAPLEPGWQLSAGDEAADRGDRQAGGDRGLGNGQFLDAWEPLIPKGVMGTMAIKVSEGSLNTRVSLGFMRAMGIKVFRSFLNLLDTLAAMVSKSRLEITRAHRTLRRIREGGHGFHGLHCRRRQGRGVIAKLGPYQGARGCLLGERKQGSRRDQIRGIMGGR